MPFRVLPQESRNGNALYQGGSSPRRSRFRGGGGWVISRSVLLMEEPFRHLGHIVLQWVMEQSTPRESLRLEAHISKAFSQL